MPKPAPSPVPAGMNTLTTQLWFKGDCDKALDFYQKAFGAELVGNVARGPGGKGIMHAMLKLGNAHIMVADAWPGAWERAPQDGATAGLFIYVEDCDRLFERATAAGCEVLFPMGDMFWGDRMGKVKDPFGHCWGIATNRWIMTDEEVEKGQEEFFKSFKS